MSTQGNDSAEMTRELQRIMDKAAADAQRQTNNTRELFEKPSPPSPAPPAAPPNMVP